MVSHAARGQISGPFSKLPPESSLRTLALDVAYTVSRSRNIKEGVDELDIAVCGVATVGERAYWSSLHGDRVQ